MIRRARPEDGPAVLKLIEELARFEKLDPPTPEARERLLRDAFGPKPAYELFVADSNGAVVAYAISFMAYSSFLARPTLYLEDLYITETHRGTGLAREFMRFLAKAAVERGCGRLDGVVLDWNKRARKFYAKTGAREFPNWVLFRYEGPALKQLAD